MLSKSAVSRSLRLWLANGWPLRHLIQLIAALLCLWTTVATADEQGDLEGYFSFVTDDFSWVGSLLGKGYRGRESTLPGCC